MHKGAEDIAQRVRQRAPSFIGVPPGAHHVACFTLTYLFVFSNNKRALMKRPRYRVGCLQDVILTDGTHYS